MTLLKIGDYLNISWTRKVKGKTVWKHNLVWEFRIIVYGPKWRMFKARINELKRKRGVDG